MKLLVLSKDYAQYQALLQPQLPEQVELVATDRYDADPTVEIALAEPAMIAPLLAELPQLKWLQSTFAGVDALMKEELRQDYLLTNIRGVFGPLMSEYVLGHIIALERRYADYQKQQQHKVWQSHSYRSLQGKRMLILGTGSIGQHLAGVASAFGISVTGISRSGQRVAGFQQTYPLDQLSRQLPDADYIVSALPDTPQTRHLFNENTFSCMKPNAVLINIGRGSAVDQEQLVAALNKGRPGHAVLDVFQQEPLPEEDPLWYHPKVTVTPHNAAYSFPEQVSEIFCANLKRWMADEAPQYQVDFSKGY